VSRGLHGDPKTAQRDRLIRGVLELNGYTVTVVQSRDLDDAQAVRQHLKSIAQAMGRETHHRLIWVLIKPQADPNQDEKTSKLPNLGEICLV